MFYSIKWPNEIVSRSVTIYDEFDVLLIGTNEVSKCSAFWLGECLLTWPVVTAKFSVILIIFLFPIDTIVSV